MWSWLCCCLRLKDQVEHRDQVRQVDQESQGSQEDQEEWSE